MTGVRVLMMNSFSPRFLVLTAALVLGFSAGAGAQGNLEPQHGVSMYGELKYGPGFEHFDYVNPDAPVGGTLALSSSGTFDSLNPYILKGSPAAGLGMLFETLMAPSLDEPFAEYGLIAESIVVPEDRSWVTFILNPDARWQDGEPVTADDVVFSFETLTTRGHPMYRSYYANVAKVEKLSEREVKFTFDGETNRELPLIMGQLPVLPKHYYEKVEFDRTTLTPPVGSGPYKIKRLEAGRYIVYGRDPNYWGWDLPVNRGHYNFDEIRYEYYRDRDIEFEALKAGQFDLWLENSAKRWATAYTGGPFESGRIVKEELEIPPPARMQGYIFNLRREKFADPRVREAISQAFDFEWTNQNLMYGAYERITSYFHGEEGLASSGLPGPAELKLLEPYRDQLPEEVFTKEYRPPSTAGETTLRDNLRKAFELLREAGYEIQDGRMVHKETGRPLEFEILLNDPAQERLAGPFVKNLERLGITARIRTVDTAQYQNRMDDFDFDMTVELWAQSDSPGNEQREFWGSAAADIPGSRNTVGIKDPVVDALTEKVIRAPTRDDLEAAVRALDRVLLWGHYVVPHFTDDGYRVAFWNKFGRPDVLPKESPDFMAWWIDPVKVAALQNRGGKSGAAEAKTID
jgi:microcin C transport system substrate-binding protein